MADNKQNDKDMFSSDIENVFEDFLKNSTLEEEFEVTPDLKIKLRALNIEEIMIADSIMMNYNPNVPENISVRLRGAAQLSRSIMEFRGIIIEPPKISQEEIEARRYRLFKEILKLNPVLVQKMYEKYIELINKQEKLYVDGNLGKTIENF